MLSDLQIERYSRQIILPQVGGKGQQQLLDARVFVSGNNRWQAQALLYLAAAGVGKLGISESDRLQAWTAPASQTQAAIISALSQLNPDCAITIHNRQSLDSQEGRFQLVQQYDLVIAEPSIALHAACCAAHRPFVCGQVSATNAWLAVYRGYEERFPCLECEGYPSTEEILAPRNDNPADSLIGTLLATEAIKLILRLNVMPPAKLLQYNTSDLSFRDRVLVKNPHCSVCRRE